MKSLILIVLFVLCGNLYGNKTACNLVLTQFDIDVKTKGYKGWQRVCNNNKLYLYTKKSLSLEEEKEICDCFYYDYKDRDLGIKEER